MIRRSTSALAGEVLLQPTLLIALGLWIVNDHFLKHLAPGWITGKLSDVACLIALPLLLLASVELTFPAWARHHRSSVLGLSVFLAGVVMVLINVSVRAVEVYEVGLGLVQWPLHAGLAIAREAPVPSAARVVTTMDPSDLATLPALAVPLWVGKHTTARGRETAA